MRTTFVLMVAALAVVGCPCFGPAPFTLDVTPTHIADCIPGQRCVFLVTVAEPDAGKPLSTLVHITVSGFGADVMVEHEDILPGEMAEVTVIPRPIETFGKQVGPDDGRGRSVYAAVHAECEGHTKVKVLPIRVTSEEEDTLQPDAVNMRDLFIPWLAENHPELGITEEIEWTPTIVTPTILIVSHYLFFSEEWEIHVSWHVMIPPSDWARIELRRRFEETTPSLAFEISSVSAEPPLDPQPIEPSDTLWR